MTDLTEYAKNRRARKDRVKQSFSQSGPLAITEFTDIGVGRRLAREAHEELKYCEALHAYVGWNGRFWEWNSPDALLARAIAKRHFDDWLRDATELATAGNAGPLTGLLKLYKESGLGAILKNARDETTFQTRANAFDRNPYLLNVENGTLDLETLTLREFRHEDYITGCLAVPYIEGAHSRLWEQHIRYLAMTATGEPRPELERFYWRAIGYTLLGSNPERTLFFLKGVTTGGKSTLLEALRELFGQLAYALAFQSLLIPPRAREAGGDAARPDLVGLFGKRFATASEPRQGERGGEFDGALLKRLTGGDMLRLRDVYSPGLEFRCGAKLWLSANHPPKIESEDEALWVRFCVLPVEYRLPDALKDDKIVAKLTAPTELEGALAMAVRGLAEYWQLGGLKPPAEAKQATTQYRDDNDVFKLFVEECCTFSVLAKTPVKAILDRLKRFCADEELTLPCTSSRGLKERLLDLDRSPRLRFATQHGSVAICIGLALAQETEPTPADQDLGV